MQKNINILIVDDEPLIADDISGHLKEAGYTNIACAFDADDAIRYLNSGDVDFLLLDINLNQGMKGTDIARLVNSEFHLPFVFITSYADTQTIQEVKALHPVGYIVKPFNGREIHAVLEVGYELFYTYMGKAEEFNLEKLNKLASEELTQKEFEVVKKIAEGKNNKQISEELFVSVNTIKTHLKNIFVKLDVASRSEAMVLINRSKM